MIQYPSRILRQLRRRPSEPLRDSAAGLALVISLFFPFWIEDERSRIIECESKTNISKCPGSNKTGVIDLFWANKFNFHTPCPYGLIVVGLYLIAAPLRLHEYSQDDQLDSLKTQVQTLTAKFDSEEEDHGSTRRELSEVISSYLELVLWRPTFGDSTRLTIYRHSGDGFLRCVFRHSNNPIYQEFGRIRISDNEGIVGAAWRSTPPVRIAITHSYGTKAYGSAMDKELRKYGTVAPDTSMLRMPSRRFYAFKVEDASRINSRSAAVIVLESEDNNHPSNEEEDALLAVVDRRLSQLIILKARLDELLQPYPEANP